MVEFHSERSATIRATPSNLEGWEDFLSFDIIFDFGVLRDFHSVCAFACTLQGCWSKDDNDILFTEFEVKLFKSNKNTHVNRGGGISVILPFSGSPKPST